MHFLCNPSLYQFSVQSTQICPNWVFLRALLATKITYGALVFTETHQSKSCKKTFKMLFLDKDAWKSIYAKKTWKLHLKILIKQKDTYRKQTFYYDVRISTKQNKYGNCVLHCWSLIIPFTIFTVDTLFYVLFYVGLFVCIVCCVCVYSCVYYVGCAMRMCVYVGICSSRDVRWCMCVYL